MEMVLQQSQVDQSQTNERKKDEILDVSHHSMPPSKTSKVYQI